MTTTHLGFSGTKRGMTKAQLASLHSQLTEINEKYTRIYFHHGDCVGADEQAHDLAHELGWDLRIHPPIETKMRAFCYNGYVYAPKKYLPRDRDIVNVSDQLIACPNQISSTNRKGGTWYTINYAESQNKPVTLIGPDGSVSIL